jgi:hypothetical protein
MKYLPLLVIVLAGCAATPEQARQALPSASNYEVCESAFLAGGEVGRMAQQEAIRRGLRCREYEQAVFQARAKRAAAVDAIVQQQASQPAPVFQPTTRPPVSCTSYRIGTNVQTDCR